MGPDPARRAVRPDDPTLAARPAGGLLRWERDVPDAARDAARGRALARSRPFSRKADRARRVGGQLARGARVLALQRERLRLRLVDPDHRRTPLPLRLGLRRTVHLRRALAA